MRSPLVRLSLLTCLGYFLVARLAAEAYPFSTFPMFEGGDHRSASRIVARTGDGRLHEVSEYAGWDCDQAPSGDVHACPELWPFEYTPYVDAALLADIASHAGDGASVEAVEVVRHVWRLDTPRRRTEDCVLASCRARRR